MEKFPIEKSNSIEINDSKNEKIVLLEEESSNDEIKYG
jgi:hypothetical protein